MSVHWGWAQWRALWEMCVVVSRENDVAGNREDRPLGTQDGSLAEHGVIWIGSRIGSA